MKRLLLAVVLAGTCASAAFAAPPPRSRSATGEERIDALIVYGNDPCPRGSGDEIVVCAHKPESERYRIPPNLRDDPNAPANQSWANRADKLEYVGRTGIGSCSTVGPGGWTGCLNQLIQQARAERGETDVNMTHLIEQAREERNATIAGEATEGSQGQQQPITPPK
ncbi:MAG TPA: hypothetical protein VH331_14685 [Allosphingosinicella sp.]|jgi:hypothetical protein|nr:hypothetical protein [Allosphingosinicella sp.]